MKTKIALCQLTPVANNPERNFSTMEETIKNCSKERVRLCIFPEDFLYGIVSNKANIETAGRKSLFWINNFRRLAKKYKLDLIPGSFPLYEKGLIYNTTIYINRQGKIINQYHKTNLWLSERSDYTPSNHPPQCFESILGKTLLIICWDIMDHKLFATAVKQNAKWVMIISCWSSNQSSDLAKERGKPLKRNLSNVDSKIIDSLINSRVNEYNIGIIFCNFAKSFRYQDKYNHSDVAISTGHTQIASPLFHMSKKINGRKEQILIYDVLDIKQLIEDTEILYGRREDIKYKDS